MNKNSIIQPSDRMQYLPEYLFGKLNARKLKMRKAGRDIIDFGMGNPDQPTDPLIVEKLKDVAEDDRAHRYSVNKGIPHLRQAVADHYHQYYQVILDPDSQIISTIGSKEGVSHLSLALVGQGDLCVVPQPAFPVHVWSTVIAGGVVAGVPVDSNPDTFINSIEKDIQQRGSKPKVLFLNFPHNPTTTVVDLHFFEKIISWAHQHKVFVVHDFAYKDITYDGYTAPSILQVDGAQEVAVEFISMSKSFNMAGWRCGFCVGNTEAISLLEQIKGYYDYGIFTPVQVAAISALRNSETLIPKIARKYQQRRDALVDGLSRSNWIIPKPKAAMFVWAEIPEEFRHWGSLGFADLLLEDAEVLVSPGIGFGDEGDNYIRMSLIENTERIRQAVKQINKVIRRG